MTEPSDVDWLQGSCLLMQSNDFAAINGFDEAYFMYVEDTDLCWRLGQRGRRVVFEPRAVVRHLGGSSTKKRPTTMALAHHRSALRFWWRSRTGRQRLAAPLAVGLLGIRLVAVLGMKWVTRLLPASLQRRETDADG
jgi:N-acetylglucosaminyl-diphospho-decaprenol L-rhamnosyltransferase